MPKALKTRTATIVNERKNARILLDMDPPSEKTNKKKALPPLNYTDLKGASQRAKGYRR